MTSLPDLREFLTAAPRRVALVGHRNPDGDAIGSTLAMRRFLEPLGHACTVIVPSEYPSFLRFLAGVDDVLVADASPDETALAVREAELVVLQDFNSLDRIDKLGEWIAARGDDVPRVLIDHHLDPEPVADVAISDPTASSTCELVYRTIVELGMRERVTPAVAEALMTGILTDTGGFSYATSARLFRIVGELFDVGVDNERLQAAIFNSMSEKQLRLLGHCLANRMEVLHEYGAALITLSKRDYEHFDIQRGDTEGIVNYMLRMGEVELAAFITEQPKITKLSLRSKGDVDVRALARDHFKGGGHRNAAGGASYRGLRATVARFKAALAQRAEGVAEAG